MSLDIRRERENTKAGVGVVSENVDVIDCMTVIRLDQYSTTGGSHN